MNWALGDIRRFAARTVLLTVPRGTNSVLVARTLEFLDDSGAIGLLLDRYQKRNSIEDVCLFYWSSRTEKNAARLEDLVTMALISVACSVTAGVIVQLLIESPKLFRRRVEPSVADALKALQEDAARARHDFLLLYTALLAKAEDRARFDGVAQALYEHVESGKPLSDFAWDRPLSKPKQLDFMEHVARGVVLTELQRTEPTPFVYSRKIGGLSLSSGLAGGEVVVLRSAIFGDTEGHLQQASEALETSRLYPELWPEDLRGSGIASSKVLLIVGDYLPEHRELLHAATGAIATIGGMTGHLGVSSRGLRRPAIVVSDLTPDEIERARFAVFEDGDGSLYFDRPAVVGADFRKLFGG